MDTPKSPLSEISGFGKQSIKSFSLNEVTEDLLKEIIVKGKNTFRCYIPRYNSDLYEIPQ